jgi:flagellar biosynthesis/type III secretory pathway M-ring protein FliF/YscJ
MSDIETLNISNLDFSLGDIPDINEVNEVIFSSNSEDYLKYIYIAIAIVIIVILFLIYKYFVNREKKVTFQDKLDDCYGDVCYR